ncbi:hypothetical protein AGMMS50293_05830 [Spirochaetia bacterium]|nr:hypothetical protein AGMMS50293_05830 [Spirochaetia bacterium]
MLFKVDESPDIDKAFNDKKYLASINNIKAMLTKNNLLKESV